MCRLGLAITRDVIQLTLDGKQGGLGNRFRPDPLAVNVPFAFGQQEFLKDNAHRVEIIFRRHVEHCVVFVVKLPMRFRTVTITFDEMVIKLPVRIEVAIRIHCHEARVLQKSRIDLAGKSRMVVGHTHDEPPREP